MVDPAVAVADDVVVALDELSRNGGVAFQRERWTKIVGSDLRKRIEQIAMQRVDARHSCRHTPETDSWVKLALALAHQDRWPRSPLPAPDRHQRVALGPLLVIDDKVERQPGAIGPFEFWRVAAVANEVAQHLGCSHAPSPVAEQNKLPKSERPRNIPKTVNRRAQYERACAVRPTYRPGSTSLRTRDRKRRAAFSGSSPACGVWPLSYPRCAP